MSMKKSEKNAAFDNQVAMDIDVRRVIEAAFLTPMGNLFGSSDGEMVWAPPIVLHSPPGAGKTSYFGWLSKRYAAPFVNMKPGARGEGAIGVVPLPVALPDGRVVLDFPPPGELVQKFPNKKGLVLVDDLATMAPALQPAYLDVLQERMLGTYRFGGGVRVFGATNSVEDSAGGWDIAPSVANRMGHMPWADPSGADLGKFLQLSADKLDFDDEVIDLEREEHRVLNMWPDFWARASQLFAGFLMAHPSMVRRQPKFGDPNASKAWASPRSIEYACRAYAGGMLHRLPAAELNAFVGAFVGQSWANEFETYAVNADLPEPRAFLNSVLAKKPIFTHSRTRLDRTTVVLQACVALVSQPQCADRKDLADGLWQWMHLLTDECSDLLAPCVQSLWKAKLVGMPSARPVLAAMEPVVNATRL
jgi:hypothetical protein